MNQSKPKEESQNIRSTGFIIIDNREEIGEGIKHFLINGPFWFFNKKDFSQFKEDLRLTFESVCVYGCKVISVEEMKVNVEGKIAAELNGETNPEEYRKLEIVNLKKEQ